VTIDRPKNRKSLALGDIVMRPLGSLGVMPLFGRPLRMTQSYLGTVRVGPFTFLEIALQTLIAVPLDFFADSLPSHLAPQFPGALDPANEILLEKNHCRDLGSQFALGSFKLSFFGQIHNTGLIVECEKRWRGGLKQVIWIIGRGTCRHGLVPLC